MKTLDPALAGHLAGAATTLATCWTLERTDGVVMGFTDHDRPIVLAGVAHEAASGLGSSEDVAQAGLAVGGAEISGALASAAITEADIAAALDDGAEVTVTRVDWSNPAARVVVRRGTIGEVIAADGAFRAEIRSLAAVLDQPRGRLYAHRCDADLGDARCGVDLAAPARRGTGTVDAVGSGRDLVATGLAAFAAGLFERGRLVFASGANAGRAAEVRHHAVEAGGARLELWRPMLAPIAPGDGFVVTVGCDKRFETCRDRFANALAFRGFPHIPGSDFLVAHPARDHAANDGEALVS